MVTKSGLITLKKDVVKYQEYLAKKRISRRIYEKQRLKAGICIRCFKNKIDKKSTYACRECMTKQANHRKRYYKKAKRKKLCVNCYKPLDNKFYVQCTKCYNGK